MLASVKYAPSAQLVERSITIIDPQMIRTNICRDQVETHPDSNRPSCNPVYSRSATAAYSVMFSSFSSTFRKADYFRSILAVLLIPEQNRGREIRPDHSPVLRLLHRLMVHGKSRFDFFSGELKGMIQPNIFGNVAK